MLGASVGSFLNVVALRRSKEEGFLTGRSCCMACGCTLIWHDLIPVISWFILFGKCRACKVRISLRYVLIEIITGFVFALVFIVFGFAMMTLLTLAVVMILLAISLIDLSTMEIPNGLNMMLVPLAIAAIWIWSDIGLASRGLGFFVVSFPMLIVTMIIDRAFGGGDIKLMAVCGFLLGWQNALLAFFIAILLGGGWAIYLIVTHKRKKGEHMVFGPALCIGVLLAILYGEHILAWYLGLLFF